MLTGAPLGVNCYNGGVRGPIALLLAARLLHAEEPVLRYNDPLPEIPRSAFHGRISDQVVRLAIATGQAPPQSDARLDAALNLLLDKTTTDQPPPAELVQRVLYRYGIVEPSPHLLFGSGGSADETGLLHELSGRLPSVLSSGRYRRLGVAIGRRGGELHLLLGLQETFLELRPVSRRLPAAGSVDLVGRILAPYVHPSLYLTRPDGNVAKQPIAMSPDGRFEVHMACLPAIGRFQIEITAEDRFGPAVLANFPIQCGTESAAPDTAAVERPWSDRDGTSPDAEAQLVALVQADRSRAGLPPLTFDPALSAVARAHSIDMREHHFFGHVSSSTGSAEDRLRRAHILPALVLENVGRARSPIEAERGFLESPGHRGNLLHREVTRFGVGVAVLLSPGEIRELYATQLFLRPPDPFRPEMAVQEMSARLAEIRRGGGSPDPDRDTELDRLAAEVSHGLATGALPLAHSSQPVERAMPQLRRFHSVRTVVLRSLEIRELSASKTLLDPQITSVGLAAARGPSDPEGRNLFLVLLLGVRRATP